MLAILVFCYEVLPGLVRNKIISEVEKKCPQCSLKIKRLSISYLPELITLRDAYFKVGNKRSLELESKIEKVKFHISLWDVLFNGEKLAVDEIHLLRPLVKITEGEVKEPLLGNGRDKGIFRFYTVFTKITVIDGVFNYIQESRVGSGVREARVHLDNINGNVEIKKMGISDKEGSLQIGATGILGTSGRLKLEVRALPFSAEQNLDLDLQINEQDLSDVNSFFKTEDGLLLKGNLSLGRTWLHIRGSAMTVGLIAHYKELKLHFEKKRGRGAVSAFFYNLLESIQVKKNSKKKNNPKLIEINREATEGLIHFILRGMKTGAIRFST